MKLVSVNVRLPREVKWKGRVVTTGIFKEPVAGDVRVRTLNLDGDRQADLSVHGGPDKAVYLYPSEHYDYWHGELPGVELPWGMFGENLTSAGLSEEEVHIGDRFRVGSSEMEVSQPRMPCYKLAVKFGRDDILKRFLASGRTGFYLRVLAEGQLATGAVIAPIKRASASVPVAEIARLYRDGTDNADVLRRVAAIEALADGWRDYFRGRLEKLRS